MTDVSGESVINVLEEIKGRLNILIGFQIRQNEEISLEKKIKMLKKMGMSYPEIETILSVSSATIAKLTKKK